MIAADEKILPVHEHKYVTSNIMSTQVIGWLQRACLKDHEFPEGMVSSVYYDTGEWHFLGEKINSDYLKTKVRVRWYSDINNEKHSDNSFIEAKFKIGGRREKLRAKTHYSGNNLLSISLSDPEFLKIPPLLYPEGFVSKQTLYPVYQISYKRQRFIEPVTGTRICFDYDISTPRVNPLMVVKFNHFMLQKAVFEIKGHLTELPAHLRPLTYFGLKRSSFSKYSMCYLQIFRTRF